MRITVLNAALGIPVYGPSGASAHLRGITRAFRRLGHEVDLVSARAEDGRGAIGARDLRERTIQVPGWPSWLPRWRERRELWAARRLASLAAEGPAPDLIYERWSLFSDAGARLRGKTGARWILEVNAPLMEERLRYEELRDRAFAEEMQAKTLRSADLCVAVSSWVHRWLTGLGARSVHIPNGTDDLRGDREATRARLGLEGQLVIGFLGSGRPWHGVERLEGIARAAGGVPLVVSGVDEVEAAHRVAAMDIGLAPYRSDAPPWFSPLKIPAYRAQGTPVIASDLGDDAAMVGEGGVVVPADDDAAFAAACRAWAGRRAAPQLRSWEQVAAEILAA